MPAAGRRGVRHEELYRYTFILARYGMVPRWDTLFRKHTTHAAHTINDEASGRAPARPTAWRRA